MKPSKLPLGKVVINNHTFTVELAKKPDDREIGLARHTSLPENHGMLFMFDKASLYKVWMQGMQFPIDIIFIKDSTIDTIYHNAPLISPDTLPEIYEPQNPVNYILEINAGLAKRYNLRKGDLVSFH